MCQNIQPRSEKVQPQPDTVQFNLDPTLCFKRLSHQTSTIVSFQSSVRLLSFFRVQPMLKVGHQPKSSTGRRCQKHAQGGQRATKTRKTCRQPGPFFPFLQTSKHPNASSSHKSVSVILFGEQKSKRQNGSTKPKMQRVQRSPSFTRLSQRSLLGAS